MKKAKNMLTTILIIISTLLIYVNVPNLEAYGNKYLAFTNKNNVELFTKKVVLSKSPSTVDQDAEQKIPNHDQENTYYNNENKKWKLFWHDEFDQERLHRGKWVKEDWAAEKNNELQYYTPKNIEIENGVLKLISRKEEFGDRKFTSGAIHSKDKFKFQYGKVEMRAKLPKGKGIFPAFWMLPNQDDRWLPEIDIMEMLGDNPDETWMVIHWLDDKGNLKTEYKSYLGVDYSIGFHTFGIEWTPDKVIWFIDGVERFQTERFIPQEEMYLYVNTAIGGDWPGNPDDFTVFPQYFEIDYIRVYQLTGEDL